MTLRSLFVSLAVAASLALGACVTVTTSDDDRPCASSTASTSSSTGAGGAPATSSSTGAPCAGPVCVDWLDGPYQSDELCPGSAPKADALGACACTGLCAAACSYPGESNCLAAWGGNPPLACKTCLVSATGCKGEWDSCITDDGAPTPSGATSSSTGGACVCDPAMVACPGGGECAHVGAVGPVAGNEACGTAQYCGACCNLGGGCATDRGTCQITKISGVACAADFECCSGVCAAGVCAGGCGVILPGSGASSSGTGP
jgi:hypothetical protein